MFKTFLLIAFLLLVGCYRPETKFIINSPEHNFEVFWKDFYENYSFFQLKGIDWKEVYKTYRPKITPATTQNELQNILTEIILNLKDAHACLNINQKSIRYNYVGNHPKNQPVNISSYVSLQKIGNVLKYGIIKNSYGYLRISKFSGIESDFTAIETILTQWLDKNLQGVIIDIRGNAGGNERYSAHIIKSFNDQPRLYSKVKLRRGKNHNDFTAWIDRFTPVGDNRLFANIPIMVLTNRYVASTAESFVLAMRTIPNVTIVGDTTGGSSANPYKRTLPNGWKYGVSNWIEATPEGTIFENIGLAPDVPVWIREEDLKSGKDTILEKALTLVEDKPSI